MKDLASVTIGRRTFVRMLGMSATIPLAAWIVAACGDDDDDDTAGGEATSETSGESSSTEGAATTEGSTAESSAAENTPAEEAAQSGGDVVIGLDQEPPTLDPHASPSAVTYQIISSVTESLLYLDSERQLQPWLAEEWDTSEDGTSYTFTLRQDVTFHDGEPFNAEAVQWNFDRIVSPDFEAGSALTALSGYTGSEVVDEYTVKVNFEKAYGPFLTYAAGGTLGMVSPKAVQELGDDFGTQVVGSGPFKVDSYTASDNTVVVRNEDYNRQAPWSDREGPALLDSITFKIIP